MQPSPRTSWSVRDAWVPSTSSHCIVAASAQVSLGRLVATPGAIEALEESGQTFGFFMQRHVLGDWGEVDEQDWQLNDQAVKDGSRILSAYCTLKGKKLWLITEADRSSTCILLPEEY